MNDKKEEKLAPRIVSSLCAFGIASLSVAKHKYTNGLISEKSPYLQQHAHNPVNWYPWGQEAFDKAKAENKLIFLSVGYSTCHWCHVMENESFDNESIAALMNLYCVNIKVDREERPDVDKVYMTYIQATQGGGGWPMSVFLTPSLKPLMGGTYYPPNDTGNRPGFRSVITQLGETWRRKQSQLEARSEAIITQIREQVMAVPKVATDMDEIEAKSMQNGFLQAESGFDADEGGFGEAPKFPRPVVFNFLFRVWHTWRERAGHINSDEEKKGAIKALHMCEHTLEAMARGGIHDHIGGGFHRYSTTHDWHIPHYEKMLYDQAQISSSYIDAYQITRKPLYEEVARGILDYVAGPVMCHHDGAFFSAEDADSLPPSTRTMGVASKKLEGAFYVWEYDEIMAVLGADNGALFAYMYGVERKGNTPEGADPHGELTGQNTLIVRHTVDEAATKFTMTTNEVDITLQHCRQLLLQVRNKRPRPHLDDKIITSWNGLMISAFARAAQVFDDRKYLHIAIKAASFIRSTLYNETTGRLIRNYKDGPSTIDAFADDYAFMIQALIDLYEASYDIKWLKWAVSLQSKQDELFWDKSSAGYFDSIDGDKSLLYRTKEDYDGSEPSPNSISALNLIRLGQMLSMNEMIGRSKLIILSFNERLTRAPFAVPQMVVASLMFIQPIKQIIIALPTTTTTPPTLSSTSSTILGTPTSSTISGTPTTLSSTSSLAISSSVPLVESKSSLAPVVASSVSISSLSAVLSSVPSILSASSISSIAIAKDVASLSLESTNDIWSQPIICAIHSKYVPDKIIMVIDSELTRHWFGSYNSFLATLHARDNQTTAFVCQHFTCKLPTHNPLDVIASL